MIKLDNLRRRFPGQDKDALKGATFSVRDGEFVVIGGANGSGKSVLMHLIASLDKPTSGTVYCTDAEGRPARVGLVFQDADAQILGDTPLEDVSVGPKNLGFSRTEAAAIARGALARAGLEGKEGFPARSLSGGEKRRLAVAGILALDAPIIILDEPYANLDWPGVAQVNGIIRQLKNEGRTVIVLTHELEKVLALADRLMVLYQGEIVWDGEPREGLRSASLEKWGIRNPLASYSGVQDLLWESGV